MQWFFAIVSILWTILFVIVFFLLSDMLPESITIEIKRKPTSAFCNNPIPFPKKEEHDEVVLLDKDSLPTKLTIQSASELPDTKEELQKALEKQMQQAFENRLVNILVRVDGAACEDCDDDDRKIILQLKMMKALLEGDPDLAFYYSKELKFYLNKK